MRERITINTNICLDKKIQGKEREHFFYKQKTNILDKITKDAYSNI